VFPDYKLPPPELLPEGPGETAPKPGHVKLDGSLLALVEHWRLVVADLSRHHHINLHDPAVRAMPWTAVRTQIFSLLDEPSRLREALTIRG